MYSLYGGLVAYLSTLLGAAIVFFFKKVKKNLMDGLLSFSAGIMISAAFFSLLEPAIELSSKQQQNLFFTVFFGFLFGGIFIYVCNHLFAHLPQKGISFKRCLLC